MKFSKIKLKLNDEKFLEKNLEKWAIKEKENEKFCRFECSSFFQGSTLASLNFKKYQIESVLIDRKIKKFSRLLQRLERLNDLK